MNLNFEFNFHETYEADELCQIYHHRSYWCQNSYNELLFKLKDKYSCDRDLYCAKTTKFH